MQKLKEQQAQFGLHTPPYILIEIEDTEAELARLPAELAAWPQSTPEQVTLADLSASTGTAQVFISYSRRDIELVHRLAPDLKKVPGFEFKVVNRKLRTRNR